jgi:hypothetical protein
LECSGVSDHSRECPNLENFVVVKDVGEEVRAGIEESVKRLKKLGRCRIGGRVVGCGCEWSGYGVVVRTETGSGGV